MNLPSIEPSAKPVIGGGYDPVLKSNIADRQPTPKLGGDPMKPEGV